MLVISKVNILFVLVHMLLSFCFWCCV